MSSYSNVGRTCDKVQYKSVRSSRKLFITGPNDQLESEHLLCGVCECPVNFILGSVIRTPLLDRMVIQLQFTFQNTECLLYPLLQPYSYWWYIDNYQVVNCSVAEHHAYRITGHFCGCLISLVFCSQNIMQDKL